MSVRLPVEVNTNGIEGEFDQLKVYTNTSLSRLDNSYSDADYLYIVANSVISTLPHIEGHSIEMREEAWAELSLDWCFERIFSLKGEQVLQYRKKDIDSNIEAKLKAQIDVLSEKNKRLIKRGQRRSEEIGMLFNHAKKLREALRDILEQYPNKEKAIKDAEETLKAVENELENWNVTLGGMLKEKEEK
jgi:vacuolar-type H+-ATPase subunit I/STV1